MIGGWKIKGVWKAPDTDKTTICLFVDTRGNELFFANDKEGWHRMEKGDSMFSPLKKAHKAFLTRKLKEWESK